MENPSEAKIKQFTALYIQHNFNAKRALVAMGFKPKHAKSSAWIYKAKAQLEITSTLKRLGYDQSDVAKNFIRWANGRHGDLSIRANRELAKIFGMYPEQQAAHIGDNITVIFDVDTKPEHPREKFLTLATHEGAEPASPKVEPKVTCGEGQEGQIVSANRL